jgi:hypothetical protein
MFKKIALAVLLALFCVCQGPVKADGTSASTSFNITVVNNSSYTIETFQIADDGVGGYSADLLGSAQVIEPGDSATLTFDDYRNYCVFNVKLTTPSGDTSVIAGHNFCTSPTITIVDDNS